MNLFNRNKTFRPLKSHDEDLDGSSGNGGGGPGGGGLGPGPGGGGADGEGLHTVGRRSQLSAYAKHTLCTLGATDMRSAVMLPEGESLNEWLAVNTVDFFNELSMLYGAIGEYCTATSCPIMTGGDTVQYLWADGAKFKKPVECSAPQYVDYLMTWVESQLNDDTVFPISSSGAYPKKFQSQILPTIYKRFFRVYAHIYHSHFMRIQALGADAHLNTCFKHFVYFVEHFKLVDAKEMVPLQPIIEKMKEQDGLHVSQHQAAVQLASGSVGGTGSSGGHAKHQQLALGPSTRALVADPYALGADEDDDDGSSGGADASSTVL